MKTLFRCFIKLEIKIYRFFLSLYLYIANLGKSESKTKSAKELINYIFYNPKPSQAKSAIAIYAATIGELRAATQFINRLQHIFPDYHLVIIPGQSQYAQVFSKVYPDAMIMHEFPSHPSAVDQFFNETQTKFCFLIEGPSLHGFFPLRQDLSLPVGCLHNRVPLFVVNACLYGNSIASRFDLIEHKLFSNLMRAAIFQWYVPNPRIEKAFLAEGVPKEKLLVTGDIKLDNIFIEPLAPISNDLNQVFEFYRKHFCRLIVAGSVNEFDEQIALIRAWVAAKQTIPGAVLILVPRYINNQMMMDKLYQFLDEQKISYIRRSQGVEALATDKLLIIDVFGELPYYYEYAEVAFAGRGHGVLEPMKFSKPVVVGPRDTWEKVGSTAYHLFEQFLEKDSLIECKDYDQLGDLLTELLKDPSIGEAYIKRYIQFIQEQMGASDRIINHLRITLSKLQ